jgi:hypothetical protein
LFFDMAVEHGGREIWRARIYDEEAGDEQVVPGASPAGWTGWILDRLDVVREGATGRERSSGSGVTELSASSPVVPLPGFHHLTVELVSVRRLNQGTAPPAHRHPARIEVDLRVTGLHELERAVGAAILATALDAPSP